MHPAPVAAPSPTPRLRRCRSFQPIGKGAIHATEQATGISHIAGIAQPAWPAPITTTSYLLSLLVDFSISLLFYTCNAFFSRGCQLDHLSNKAYAKNMFSDYLADFLEYMEIERGRSLKTIENYSLYLNRFYEFAGDIKVGKIDSELVTKWRK